MRQDRAGARCLSRRFRPVFALGAALFAVLASSAAAQDVPGYGHRHWSLADGAPPDIRAIARTPDGFLWLGSGDGLYRFDGLRFERVDPEDFDNFRSRQVTALAAAKDGSLWVGYAFGGIGHLQNGKLRGANPVKKPRGRITDIAAAPDGSIWVSAWSGFGSQLRHFVSGKWDVIDVNGPLQRMYLARDGAVWIASYPNIHRLAPGSRTLTTVPGPVNLGPAFREDRAGRLWFYSSDGLLRLTPTSFTHAGVTFGPMMNGSEGIREMLFDEDDLLWISGDGAGLETVPGNALNMDRARTYPMRISTLLRDREGIVWGGAPDGLHRFVRTPVVRYDAIRGVRTGIATGPDGSLYIGADEGLFRITQDKAELVLRSSLVNDVCSVPGQGAYVFTTQNEYMVRGSKPSRIIGPREQFHEVGSGCAADTEGGLWQTIAGVGIYRLAGTRWIKDESLPPVTNFVATAPGTFVVSQPLRVVARIRDGKATPIWPKETTGGTATGESRGGVGFVRMLKQMDGMTWIGGEAGLARYDGRKVQQLSARTYPWLAGVMGIVRQGAYYWLVSAGGIVRIAAADLDRAFAQPGILFPLARFGENGSIRARTEAYVANDAAIDNQGRLWFVTGSGIVQIDPRRIGPWRRDMPVQITGIEVDGRTYPATGARLPAGTTRVGLSYVGLGLASAEGNRYRYRLDGVDENWVDAGERRRVDYAGLGPGTYRFQVTAATEDGPWARRGADVRFVIAPYFWQTAWFRLAVIAAVVLGGLALFRWRVRLAMQAVHDRIEARVAERERIARDLHDTLLQGFQGLMLRFQTVLHLTPPGSPAHVAIEDALERADDVLLHGRERVRGLREDAEPKSIAEVLRSCAARVVADALEWSVDADGAEQLVRAPVAEELELAVGEALANVVKHAGAVRVRVEVHHGRDRLALRIVDDGTGLPEEVRAAGGREGHFGLTGMRERIERLGGTFSIGNAAGGGTSIRMTLPAKIAYR
ncbi:sensor histidine kinase [Novosphingobium lindaniclasticum]|uniref:sensor histidine kinase n=1 Tax=Novosphingobium lindaniclasticum TaxID=1329895 RepID=UPI001268E51E|nr:sensor histidine kinase [Novosphingobium lindaniclasticum]